MTNKAALRTASALLLGTCWTFAALAQANDASPPAGTHFRYSKLIALEKAQTLAVEAGEIFVPENRSKANGRVISIPYYRLRSSAAQPATPIFLLAGGPGVEAIDEFEQDPGERALALFYREAADVVIFDQRGAGRARPLLECPQTMDLPLDQALTREAYITQLRSKVAQCRDAWQREKVDLAAYNTVENAADVDALRKALGYERISIVAGSYGSHLAFAVLRSFGRSIERAVLYGIEGPDHTYDMPSQTFAALQRIAKAADADASLQPFIPQGGLMAAFESVQQRLAKNPVRATAMRDGQAVAITLGKYDLQRIARDGVHNRTDMTWAANVIAMSRGDFSGAAEAALYVRDEPVDSAMYFMMDCASGISPARRKRLLHDPAEARAQEVLGEINLDYLHACDLWPSQDLGAGFRSDLRTDTPVLVFQGTWDISTPFENAQDVVRGLSNGKLIAIEAGTHWTLGDLLESRPDARALLHDFLRGRRVEAPASITLPPASFRAPAAPAAR